MTASNQDALILSVFNWFGTMTSLHVFSDQTLPDVLSSPPPDLCDSLYGLSILASDGCYGLAVLENGNPLSPTGTLQSLDVDLLNGDFLGTPLEWCQTLGHTAAQDSRRLETRPSNSLLRKRGGGGGGGVPSETYSRHHIVCLVREWCNRAERGSWKLHRHIRACLHSLGCDSRSTNPTKIKLQCDVWGAQLCFFWLRQFLTTRFWNPILCCPLLNWLPLSFQHSPLTVTKERPLPVKHWPEWWLTVKCVTVFKARLQSRQT